jgi:hypothetical protein
MEQIDSQMMRDALAEALVESLPKALPQTAKELVRDPEFWSAASKGIQEHASNKAGGMIMSFVWSAASKMILFVILGSIVYAIGGWAMVAKIFGGSIK